MIASLRFQPSLFDGGSVSIERTFSLSRRIHLDERSWVDHAPGWVSGSDRLFEALLSTRRWSQRSRWMYERKVVEPRLTDWWDRESGAALEPHVLEEMRLALSERYGVSFDSVGFNLYRDGGDGVAWHADRIPKWIAEPIVALVSLGEPRKLLLRPRGGGASCAFPLGRGDLLVTGGAAQRAWEHCVPKVARAGPRISLGFRHEMDRRAYAAGQPGTR